VVPENIHTHPMDGHWKFQGGGGWRVLKTKICIGKDEAKLESPKGRSGGGVQSKKPSLGEVWIFSENTHY